jgi:hypothetical protein
MLQKIYVRLLCLIILLIILIIIIFLVNLFNNNLSNKYLWSKRFNTINYYNVKDTESISDKQTILNQINNSNHYIWIRNTSNNRNIKTDLDYFGELLDNIKKPIILITSDGDRYVPSSYNSTLVNNILSSSKIIKWYTQNYDRTIIHNKLSYYPIGLDLHTLKWLNLSYFDKFRSYEMMRYNKFNLYLKSRFKNSNKINKIFCDSHLSLSHPRRNEMYKILKNNKLVNFLNEKVDQLYIMKKYSEHRFVLSPIGNGLDCHRTWEIFLVGSIVITESSPLDEMYIKNNLPVIILNKFDDLNFMNFDDLNKLWTKYKNKCNIKNIKERFNPYYWVK